MILFQLLLVLLFLAVAAWLDSENRRVNADNVELRSALTLARREAADLRLANQGLTEDLEGWKLEEAKRERRRERVVLN